MPDAPTTSAPSRPDVYARIRHRAPILVVVFCAALLIVVGLIRPFASPPVDIEVRQPLVASEGDPAAAYATVHNAGGSDTLLSASTPAAARVVLQEREFPTDDPAGVLVEVDSLPVPGFGDLAMQPGGDQLLLVGLTAPLTAGETVPITLVFERAGTIEVDAEAETYTEIANRLLPPRLQVPTDAGSGG